MIYLLIPEEEVQKIEEERFIPKLVKDFEFQKD
jgi:hypothetical protein